MAAIIVYRLRSYFFVPHSVLCSESFWTKHSENVFIQWIKISIVEWYYLTFGMATCHWHVLIQWMNLNVQRSHYWWRRILLVFCVYCLVVCIIIMRSVTQAWFLCSNYHIELTTTVFKFWTRFIGITLYKVQFTT